MSILTDDEQGPTKRYSISFLLKYKCFDSTHRHLVAHICVSKPGHHFSENDYSPVRRQAIASTNEELLLTRTKGTHSNEFLIWIWKGFIQENAFENGICKMLAIWSRSKCIISTVYWCIASKLKAPRNFYWMRNVLMGGYIHIQYICYHVVPKRLSELVNELNDWLIPSFL